MPTLSIAWCGTHNSPAVEGADTDPDESLLCQESNRSGDRSACEIVTAQVRWKAAD